MDLEIVQKKTEQRGWSWQIVKINVLILIETVTFIFLVLL